MSLLRRNKSDSKEQAVPASTDTPKKEAKSGGGLRQWLVDSYNGLYKIVLEPSMPSKGSVILLVVGLLIGLLWAYSVSPVVFTGANPNRLNQSAQDQWIKLVAGNYARGFYATDQAQDLIGRIDDPANAITRLLSDPNTTPSDSTALQQLQSVAQGVTGTPTPESPGFVSDLLSGWLVPALILIIGFPILTVAWKLLIQPNFVAPVVMRVQEMRNPVLKDKNDKARADLKRLQEQNQELVRMKKETVADVELGEPVTQVLKVYSKGRRFDESDEIEFGEEFLGQCGAVIPESMNDDPVAVEIWLFDMFASDDQNHKRLFLTPLASQDPALRTRLSGDPEVNLAEAAIAQAGAKVVIDSQKVRLQADMVDAQVGADGRFESFRMKITAWKKTTGRSALPVAYGTQAPVAPAPAYTPPPQPAYNPPPQSYAPPPPAQRPMSDYDNISFDPPPAAPSPFPPAPSYAPPPPAQRPMSDYDNISFDPLPVPPQAARPPQQASFSPLPPPGEDDDPFGGTGDFTPIPRT